MSGKLFEVYGNHARPVQVWLENTKCLECKKTKSCLCFDASDDEYSIIYFCWGCLQKFFEGKKSKRNICEELD